MGVVLTNLATSWAPHCMDPSSLTEEGLPGVQQSQTVGGAQPGRSRNPAV